MLEALTAVSPVSFDSLPKNRLGRVDATGFWSVQHPTWPPLPGNPSGLDVWPLGDGTFALDDREIDYDALVAVQSAGSTGSFMAQSVSIIPPGSGSGTNSPSSPYGFPALSYSTNGLWLEIVSVDPTNQVANLLLHNTTNTDYYQLLSKTNLLLPGDWALGEIKQGDGTNQTLFSPVSITDNPMMFFRAHQADWILSLVKGDDAFEPQGSIPGKNGTFLVYASTASDITNNLTVYYRMSGTASNGADYTLLSGVMTVTNGDETTEIDVQPIADNLIEGSESVVMTLIPTNTYLINPGGNDTAKIQLFDSSSSVGILVLGDSLTYEPDGPPNVPAIPAQFTLYRYDDQGITTNRLAVNYLISGTASNGVDYTLLTGTMIFEPDIVETNIDVVPLKDNLPEGLETVTLTLYPTNAYRMDGDNTNATISIGDTSTTVSMGVITNVAIEPDGPPGMPAVLAFFSVHREDSRNIFTNLSVRYVIGGTASNGVDYTFLSGTVNFAPEMQDTNIVIAPLADSLFEGSETVIITLLDTVTNGYLVVTNHATGTISIADSSTEVGISATINAAEPSQIANLPGQVGSFKISRTDTRNIFNSLTVSYLISGTASNGADYTNLSGSVTFTAGATSTNIFVQPIADYLIEGDETVVATLAPSSTNSDTYLIKSNAASATVSIADSIIFTLVTNVPSPVGIDYHSPSNSLIVSINYDGGTPNNFARIYTNLIVGNITNVVITNWSGVQHAPDEVKLATVKTNVNGFTNGDVYFSSGNAIGWLSADGTRSNLNWCILTNSLVTNALPIRGSLYVDQTGMFSNNLIAVTSDGGFSSPGKGVWSVDSQANPTLLTNLPTQHLEGVITLPNDTNKWGPWAGKIITGDEDAQPSGFIYSVATNGVVVTYNTTNLIAGGIHTEDFDIIPPNQNLFVCDNARNAIFELPAIFFTNCVGDLLITDAGEQSVPQQAKFFIVHWDAANTNFAITKSAYKRSDGTSGELEHVTFAPIDLPSK